MEQLNVSSSASYRLKLLYLEDASSVRALDVLPMTFTVLLEVLVHVKEKLFDLLACMHVLSEEARADAQMQRFLGFLLLWAFLEAAAFPPQTQFDHLGNRW